MKASFEKLDDYFVSENEKREHFSNFIDFGEDLVEVGVCLLDVVLNGIQNVESIDEVDFADFWSDQVVGVKSSEDVVLPNFAVATHKGLVLHVLVVGDLGTLFVEPDDS